MSKPLSETAIALIKARELIREKGWIKTEYESERGYCIAGALRMAMFGRIKPRESESAYLKALDILDSLLPSTISVIGWNDYGARSKKDVLAFLDRGIARAMDA